MTKKKASKPKQKALFARVLEAHKQRTINNGGRPRKRAEIQSVLGKDYHLFLEACCDTTVSTNAIWRALGDMGIKVSYVWVLHERPKIIGEYGYYYDQAFRNSEHSFSWDNISTGGFKIPEAVMWDDAESMGINALDDIPPLPSK